MAFDSAAFLEQVPHQSGVYRMFSKDNVIIYIGKARDLKKRLSSYFRKDLPNIKTRNLVAAIHHIEYTVTFSETEALILECNLIKEYQPKYNILLRDDKSYPYILITEEKHPRIACIRGRKDQKGRYYGPFPSPGAVREALHLMEVIFPVRQCEDSVYRSRSRPCLSWQIKRCMAPCVPGYCTDEEYQEQVKMARMFLEGRCPEIINNLAARMQALSDSLEFEKAALARDQLLALRKVQEQQAVSGDIDRNMDVIGSATGFGMACVHVLFIRGGRILGTRSYFPGLRGGDSEETEREEVVRAFMLQFYLNSKSARTVPEEIVTEFAGEEQAEFEKAIESIAGFKVRITADPAGERGRYLKLATANAESSLKARAGHEETLRKRTEALEELLGVSGLSRMECYDISHTMGEAEVASCVVFGRDGPETSEYRRYNITGITPGDDFAAMHQVLTRRLGNLEPGKIPDIMFIDGGAGQLSQAEEAVTAAFRDRDDVKPPLLIGVAKGEGRKPGLETLIRGYSREEYHLTLDNPALQLVLHIRDESHRFAITGHRRKREKARNVSRLQDIPGIGEKRRQSLLTHLGGMKEVFGASAEEISKVPGISRKMAQEIYSFLHE